MCRDTNSILPWEQFDSWEEELPDSTPSGNKDMREVLQACIEDATREKQQRAVTEQERDQEPPEGVGKEIAAGDQMQQDHDH